MEANPSKRFRVIEALATQAPDETIAQVAERAGVSRATVFRYLQDDTFKERLAKRVRAEFTSRRLLIANALIKGAVTPGPGQSGMQKLYWQMQGELRDSIELSGPNGSPIKTDNEPEWIKHLSTEDKDLLLDIIDRAMKNKSSSK